MKLSLTIKILTVVLIAVFSSHAVALTTSPAVEITILSSSLGKEGDKFPEELVKFWNGIPMDQDSKTIDIIPKIKLIRIDLVDEKEFVFPTSFSIISFCFVFLLTFFIFLLIMYLSKVFKSFFL